MAQGFDSWFGLPYSHDMRMVTPNTQGAQNPKLYDRSRRTGTCR